MVKEREILYEITYRKRPHAAWCDPVKMSKGAAEMLLPILTDLQRPFRVRECEKELKGKWSTSLKDLS